jgi:twitching motility protein PilU
VILMGEIRDRETMEHAIQFAETGHLCLATLHANSANQAIDRIINFFPENEARTSCWMDLSLNLKRDDFAQQSGSDEVDGQGRRAAIEVMINTPLVADHIRKGKVGELKERDGALDASSACRLSTRRCTTCTATA